MTDWANAQKKAQETGRWAETIMKVLARLSGAKKWKFISFRGDKKGESRGVVDVVAIKRNHLHTDSILNKGDLFDIILVQCKGGKAKRPTAKDIARMQQVKEHHKARAIVLFEWEKATKGQFFVLKHGEFPKTATPPKDIFDPKPLKCNICKSVLENQEFSANYPHLVCKTCDEKAVNSKNKKAKDSGNDSGDNPVFIDGVKCWRRYRFGGHVTMRDKWNCQDLDEFFGKSGFAKQLDGNASVSREIGEPTYPKTVKEAVGIILSGLSGRDKLRLRNTKKDDLIKYHEGWGSGIRNDFGLWAGNDALMKDANACHPDEVSDVIIEAVWKSFRRIEKRG